MFTFPNSFPFPFGNVLCRCSTCMFVSNDYIVYKFIHTKIIFYQSAYCDDFCDLRDEDVWKVARPPEVRITLGPHHSQGGTLHSHVKVVLRIGTTDGYPYT